MALSLVDLPAAQFEALTKKQIVARVKEEMPFLVADGYDPNTLLRVAKPQMQAALIERHNAFKEKLPGADGAAAAGGVVAAAAGGVVAAAAGGVVAAAGDRRPRGNMLDDSSDDDVATGVRMPAVQASIVSDRDAAWVSTAVRTIPGFADHQLPAAYALGRRDPILAVCPRFLNDFTLHACRLAAVALTTRGRGAARFTMGEELAELIAATYPHDSNAINAIYKDRVPEQTLADHHNEHKYASFSEPVQEQLRRLVKLAKERTRARDDMEIEAVNTQLPGLMRNSTFRALFLRLAAAHWVYERNTRLELVKTRAKSYWAGVCTQYRFFVLLMTVADQDRYELYESLNRKAESRTDDDEASLLATAQPWFVLVDDKNVATMPTAYADFPQDRFVARPATKTATSAGPATPPNTADHSNKHKEAGKSDDDYDGPICANCVGVRGARASRHPTDQCRPKEAAKGRETYAKKHPDVNNKNMK